MNKERIAELKLAAEGVAAIHKGARMPVEAAELLSLIHRAESCERAWESAQMRADIWKGRAQRPVEQHSGVLQSPTMTPEAVRRLDKEYGDDE